MNMCYCILSITILLLLKIGVSGFASKTFDVPDSDMSKLEHTRRHLFQTLISNTVLLTSTSSTSLAFTVAEKDDNIDVYFGCGCFWHVQHEFVEAERKLLKRTELELTARAGYAGGIAGARNGKVCYHNADGISDYGSLGHAEVVQLSIPKSFFGQFVNGYCNLFNKYGYRPDQLQDRGPEYRNLVGIPGGVNSPLLKELVDSSKEHGDKLDFAKGNGNDPDIRGLVFVMDTGQFPVYVAESYHQFHDGFGFGENYSKSYNQLAALLAKEGKLEESQCPNGS